MARHRPHIDEWEIYVPNVDDGEERRLYAEGSADAITMEIRHLSKRNKEHFARVAERADKSPEHRIKAEREMRRLLAENVRGIKNYSVDGGRAITSGDDLYELGEDDIKADVTRGLLNLGKLTEGLAKNLSSPSATLSSRRTTYAGGDAQNATRPLNPAIPGTPTPTTQSCGSPTQTSAESDAVKGTPIPTSPGHGPQVSDVAQNPS